MDAARPGQERPDRAEVLDLVRGGLRQRFRLPAGRAMLAVAVVAALLAGGIGAAGGAWAGWQAGRPTTPDDAEVLRLAGRAFGTALPAGTSVSNGDYRGVRESYPIVDEATRALISVDARAAATRVAAEGWDVGPIRTGRYGPGRDTHRTAFVAERDGVLLHYAVDRPDESGIPYAGVSIRPAWPWTVHAGGAAGALLAAVAVWLFAAWTGYRLRRADPAWRVAGTLCATTTLVATALPAATVWVDGVRFALPDPVLLHEPRPLWGTFDPFDGFQLVIAAAFLLVTAVITAAARRDRPLAVTPPA
ncbi:hypothetical protein JCM9533A_34120 [Catenuloplanes niger JCM 9533]